MVVALQPYVVGGVEAEDEELHRESHGDEEVGELILGSRWRGFAVVVEQECKERVCEDGGGDDGVLDVGEVGCGDGAEGRWRWRREAVKSSMAAEVEEAAMMKKSSRCLILGVGNHGKGE